MDCSVIECARLTDYALAMHSLSKHWHGISEDGSVMKVPDLINEFWVGVFDNGYKGCFRLGALTSVAYEVHMCLDRGNVIEYCHAFFRWCLEYTDLKKMVCNVPEFKKGAISTALKMGFSFQGRNSDAFCKNGRLHALIQLGITRREMEEVCRKQFRS